MRIRWLWVLWLFGVGWIYPVHAQSPLQRWDEAGVRAIYRLDAPAFRWYMQAIDETAYPLFIGAVPSSWLYALYTGQRGDMHMATAILIAESASFVAVTGLKHLVRRRRPYRVLGDISARSRSADVESPYSFPSGHTAAAFTIATVLSLQYRRWYVVVPAVGWAISVGVSRIWTGMHYPTDVLVGASVGILVGVASLQVSRRFFP